MFLTAISFVSIDEVHADPLAPPSLKDSEWRASFSPYLFLPVSVTGDSTIAGQTAALDFDTADLLDDTSDAPIIKLVNHIISQSIKARASDIHIEPYQNSFKVRYRAEVINLGQEDAKRITATWTLDGKTVNTERLASLALAGPLVGSGDFLTPERVNEISANARIKIIRIFFTALLPFRYDLNKLSFFL